MFIFRKETTTVFGWEQSVHFHKCVTFLNYKEKRKTRERNIQSLDYCFKLYQI